MSQVTVKEERVKPLLHLFFLPPQTNPSIHQSIQTPWLILSHRNLHYLSIYLSSPLPHVPTLFSELSMMAEQRSDRRNSKSQLLQELDALSQNLYQSHTARRTASFVLPRSANAVPSVTDAPPPVSAANPRPRSRRMSMSPFRSRPKSHQLDDDDDDNTGIPTKNLQSLTPLAGGAAGRGGEKKGIWSWKPMRALSHIGMQRLGCLFSVEVVAVQGLPPSMNGLRLSVAVRKKETKDGAVQTMPARVLQGAADLEETLFIRCHVYCSGKPPKFEPRPFLVYALAIDAPELDFGRSTVDLSLLVQESMERNMEGTRIRQWDVAFPLKGKAKGGELVVKLGFQIMEDGGVGIYNQAAEGKKESRNKGPAQPSSPVARGQSKSSFSVSSPRITRAQPPVMPSNSAMDFKGIDDFNLDEPAPPPPPPPNPTSSSSAIQKAEPESKTDELDLPEFDVIDRGVEIQEKDKEGAEEAAESEETADGASVASEVVKEVVHDSAHLVRMTELDVIANQIKALESMVIGDEKENDPSKTEQEDSNQQLDAEEETVTKEFLQMLELEDDNGLSFDDMPQLASETNLGAEEGADGETKSFLSDLGKGLGSVVQTRDGGYLASTNPLDSQVARKDTPKLAMQLSKPVILRDQKLTSGIEVFQKLAAVGTEELCSKLASLTSMDELMGKTAEQIAFEGMASVIISRRAKEGASSSAARSVSVLKTMAAAMNDGRKERIVTGIWNVKEEPVAVEEILPFVLQKIEVVAVEALKVQAEVMEEEAPFDVSPLPVGKDQGILDSVALPEEWEKCCEGANEVTMLVLVQLRDPLRRYEAVGGPVMVVVQAARADEGRFKVTSLHAGGMRIRSGGGGTKSNWDSEKQRLTAMQWVVAYGLAKAGKKNKTPKDKSNRDMIWSLSSRVMADMWLKPIRNPDVKFLQSQNS